MIKQKILIIMGRYLPGYKDGGPVRSIQNLVERLGQEYDFYILTTDRDHGDTESYPNIQVNAWNSVGKAQVYYVQPGGFSSPVIKLLAREMDLIYICGCFNDYARKTLWLKRQKKITCPVVIASMGLFELGAYSIKHQKKAIYMALFRMLGLFRGVLWSATNEIEVGQIKEKVGKRAGCYVAEDLPRKAEPIDREYISAAGTLKIVFLSRISQKKNLSYAIDIVSQLTGNITFDIYGTVSEANYWQYCLEKLKTLPSNVTSSYLGECESEHVPQIFSQYDVFLFPTLGENYGHVIYEAMSGGCIPIISNRTRWNQLDKEGFGDVLDLENKDQFVQTLQKYVDMDTDEMKEIAVKDMSYAVNLSVEEQLENYRTILNLGQKVK